MQRTATAFLKEKGCAPIRNFQLRPAGPGMQAQSGLLAQGGLFGVGCAAHSLYQGRRFANPDSLGAYLAGGPAHGGRASDGGGCARGTADAGVANRRGGARGWIRENAQTRRMVREGLAVFEKDRFFPTEKGMEVQDAVVLALHAIGGRKHRRRTNRRSALQCRVAPLGQMGDYVFVVVVSEFQGKLMLSRHRDRDTWETQGGHIESGETPLEAARRELYEESGVTEFEIIPVCDYLGYNATAGCGAGVLREDCPDGADAGERNGGDPAV